MKNIAVLIYDMTIEYQITIIDGISSFFKNKKDVNLFIAPVNVPHAITSEFDYQYWTTMELLKSNTYDAFIVVANSFTLHSSFVMAYKENVANVKRQLNSFDAHVAGVALLTSAQNSA